MKAKIIMDWLVENWFLVLVLIACAVTVLSLIVHFLGLPTMEQQDKVKEWLIWACIEAEKELQSGTGQLKLRQVYNMFCAVPAFTWVARVVSFELFSDWVSDALFTMKEMLINNAKLAEIVYGDKATEQVEYIKKQIGKDDVA